MVYTINRETRPNKVRDPSGYRLPFTVYCLKRQKIPTYYNITHMYGTKRNK